MRGKGDRGGNKVEIKEVIDNLCLIDNVLIDYPQGRRRGLTDEEAESRAMKAISIAIKELEKLVSNGGLDQ